MERRRFSGWLEELAEEWRERPIQVFDWESLGPPEGSESRPQRVKVVDRDLIAHIKPALRSRDGLQRGVHEMVSSAFSGIVMAPVSAVCLVRKEQWYAVSVHPFRQCVPFSSIDSERSTSNEWHQLHAAIQVYDTFVGDTDTSPSKHVIVDAESEEQLRVCRIDYAYSFHEGKYERMIQRPVATVGAAAHTEAVRMAEDIRERLKDRDIRRVIELVPEDLLSREMRVTLIEAVIRRRDAIYELTELSEGGRA